MLHLKRPNLFTVLDSFVVKFLLGIDITGAEKNRQLEIGLEAMELIRAVTAEQKEAFEKLLERTSDLPFPLTPVRMFDILCWTTEKWDVRKILNAPYGIPHKSLLHLNNSKAVSPTTPDTSSIDRFYICRKCGRKHSRQEYKDNRFCRACGTLLFVEKVDAGHSTKSQGLTHAEMIEDVIEDLPELFTTKQIIDKVVEKYSSVRSIDKNSLGTDIAGCCVNQRSRNSLPDLPKLLFSLDRGLYR